MQITALDMRLKKVNDKKLVAITWMISLLSSTIPMYIVSRIKHTSFSSLFANWDAIFLLRITNNGYLSILPRDINGKITTNHDAFFPLFPYVNKFFDSLLPGGPIVSGVILNSTIWFFTLLFFYKLAKNIIGETKSQYALFFLAFFPGSFIVFWVYSESLTILLVVLAIYFMSLNKFLTSSIFIGLATFTRPNALPYALLIPLFIIFIILKENQISIKLKLRRILFESHKILLYFLISVSGFITFNIYLWRHTKIPNAWFRIEREAWGESLKPFGELKLYLSRFIHIDWEIRVFLVVLSALISLILIWFLFIAIKRLNYHPLFTSMYIPALLVILLGLSNGPAVASLRFTLVALPVFLGIGYIATKKYAYYLMTISLLLMAGLCFFYSWGFVKPFYIGSP
jgi:hypothetical protein